MKRSKILLAMSILVITIFLLIQFLFQRTNLIPQLPTSIIATPIKFKGSQKNSIDSENVHDNNNNVKESTQDQPIVPNQSIQTQVEEDPIARDEDKSSFHQSDQSSIVIDQVNVSQILKDTFIYEHQTKAKQTNVLPEEPQLVTENKPEEPLESKVNSQSKEFTITLWTDFFQAKDYIKDEDWKFNCAHTNCRFTSNRDSYRKANALMFHSADLNVSDFPKPPRDPEQVWIYLNHESPPHTHFQAVAALNGLVNWTVTYRLDSDILLSPLFLPSPSVLPGLPVNHVRPGMVTWLVSNCQTASNRESYVDELKKYIAVDTYGACGNLTCLPKMSNECYDTLARKYYFYLSFENSLCPDYVTEKFFFALNYSMVPVVFGGADYSRIAPPNSYIDALSFESPAKLADYLIHLTRTPDEYDVYFNWKRYYLQNLTHFACQICSALNQPEQSSKTWNHLSQWWFEEAPCTRWVNGKLIPWKST